MTKHIVMVDVLKDGRVFVRPYSTTANGFDMADGLPLVLTSLEDEARLGIALVAALDRANRQPLPFVDVSLDAPDEDFLALAGVKSYAQYMKKVHSVSLRADYDDRIDTVRILPMRNDGPRGGFTPITAERAVVEYESPEQLGRAVQEAVKKATR